MVIIWSAPLITLVSALPFLIALWEARLPTYNLVLLVSWFFFLLTAQCLSWAMKNLQSSLCHVGPFSCCMQILSCSMWDLVPSPRIKHKPPALGAQGLRHWATGKSQSSCFWRQWSLCQKFPFLLPSSHLYTPKLHFPREVSQIQPGQSAPSSWIPISIFTRESSVDLSSNKYALVMYTACCEILA